VIFRNCTGTSGIAESLSKAPAGLPLWSYDNRTFTGAASDPPRGRTLWGNYVYMKVNVTTIYSGTAQPAQLRFLPLGAYVDNTDAVDPTFPALRWTPIPPIWVDPRVRGERVMDATGAVIMTVDGASASIPTNDRWSAMPQVPFWSARGSYDGSIQSYHTQGYPLDISAEPPNLLPSITVEILTDQGIETTGNGGGNGNGGGVR
jgi:hypothetical protein